MAQVYGIPQYPVYGPLAGIADLYKTYKELERRDALDAYAKEKDARTFSLEQQKANDQKAYQQGMLTDRQGERQENYASNWMRNELTRQKMEQDARIANCNGEDANTPQCLQAKAYTMRMNNEGGQQGLPPEVLSMYQRQMQFAADKEKSLLEMSSGGYKVHDTDPITGFVRYVSPDNKLYSLTGAGGLRELGALPRQQTPPEQAQPPVTLPPQRGAGLNDNGRINTAVSQANRIPFNARNGKDEFNLFNGCKQTVNGDIVCR